jgi:lipid A 3-O-deacylase
LHRTNLVKLGLALVLTAGVAAAQSNSFGAPSTAKAASGSGSASGATTAVDGPDHRGAWDLGVLTEGGFGVTENRGDFRFFTAGVHVGKVLTGNFGPGLLRGNFELGVEAFPIWQAYTPTFLRQNCTYVTLSGSKLASCSAPFQVGGTFTGASLTPDILRWNLAGTRRFTPWIQGAGGLVWTNHKFPAFGGPPISQGGLTDSTYGDNGSTDDTSVWNFTPQFGVGAHYFVSSKRSLDFGANAIHISSASLGDKNPGVNASVQFTVGYSWWK